MPICFHMGSGGIFVTGQWPSQQLTAATQTTPQSSVARGHPHPVSASDKIPSPTWHPKFCSLLDLNPDCSGVRVQDQWTVAFHKLYNNRNALEHPDVCHLSVSGHWVLWWQVCLQRPTYVQSDHSARGVWLFSGSFLANKAMDPSGTDQWPTLALIMMRHTQGRSDPAANQHLELSMGPFCSIQCHPIHKLTDPIQSDPRYPRSLFRTCDPHAI